MGKMFWGILLIVVGILIVIKHIFGLDLPVFKIFGGLILVYMGLKIIFGSFHVNFSSIQSESAAIFSEATFQHPTSDNSTDYQTIFGKGQLDLSNIDLSKGDIELEVSAIFGELTVLIAKGTPLAAKVHSAFGKVELPSQDKINFGEYNYQSESAKAGGPKLTLNCNAVFGSLKIREKP